MPIYAVTTKGEESTRLVKAKTSAGAQSFATKGLVTVELADAEAVHDLATKGVKIEDASAEPTPAPAASETQTEE